MIYVCKNCSSESKDMNFGEWCEDCVDMSREKIMPDEREYTHELIWKKYLEDKCPVCDGKVDSDSHYSQTENGGKCMAKYFSCSSCFSQYTVGYNRRRHPIISEITCNTVYKQNKKNMETKANEPINIVEYNNNYISTGLTKREYFAAMALQGLLANDSAFITSTARDAVQASDALIEELNKIK